MHKTSEDLPFEQLERERSLPERIYQIVHQKIANGEIDTRVRITETQLATMLGVSRTPVREALTRLRHEGLLGAGARGTSVVSLAREDLEEIMELRLLIEPYLAGRAAERATPDGVAELKAALEREAAAMTRSSLQRFVMANHEFRVALIRLAGNARLGEAASRHDSQVQALRRATLEKRAHREVVVDGHRALVTAIERGQARQAEKIMRELMSEARVSIVALAPVGATTKQKGE